MGLGMLLLGRLFTSHKVMTIVVNLGTIRMPCENRSSIQKWPQCKGAHTLCRTDVKTFKFMIIHYVNRSSMSTYIYNMFEEIPEDEKKPAEFYMQKMKDGLDNMRQDGKQLLLILDGLNEV